MFGVLDRLIASFGGGVGGVVGGVVGVMDVADEVDVCDFWGEGV